MKTKILLLLVLTGIALGGYIPIGIVSPDGIDFDPNLAPSPVMGAYPTRVGKIIIGEFDIVASSDRVLTIVTDLTLTEPAITTDTNDVCKYVYGWSVTPETIGLHYYNIYYSSQLYDPEDPDTTAEHGERTIVIKANIDQPPIVTGCRAF